MTPMDDVLEICIEVLREHAGLSPEHRAVRVAQWFVDVLGGEGQNFPFATAGLSSRTARSMAVSLLRKAEAEDLLSAALLEPESEFESEG